MGILNLTRISGCKIACAAFLFTFAPVFSQIICELSLESCIDYADNTQPALSVTVPKNTTRIAQAPLSVCLPSLDSIKPVDFLFTFDLSGSMKEKDGTSRQRITWAQIAALLLLDSLKSMDRVGLMGWAAQGDNSDLADTVIGGAFYQNWYHLSSDIAGAKHFIRNNLYLDGSKKDTDTFQGQTLVRQNQIPNGGYGDTPLHVSIIVALNYLVSVGGNSNKALIVLTDGANDDDLSLQFTTQYIDSITTATGITLYTVGFSGGKPSALRSLAQAGKGQFYYANNPDELLEIYSELSSVIYNNFAVNLRTTVQKATGIPIVRTVPHTGHQNLGGGKYGFTLDRVIALDSGHNSVAFTTAENNTPEKAKVAHISVSGPEITTLGQSMPTVSPFALKCREASRIKFMDQNFQENLGGTLDIQEEKFGVELQTQQQLSQSEKQVQISGGVNSTATLDTENRAVVPSSQKAGDFITVTWVHPDDPRDIAVNRLFIGDSRVVRRAWIIDGDKNGRADSVIIEYAEPIHFPPTSITDIRWPDNSTQGKSASSQGTPGNGLISLMPGSSTQVVIDFSQNEFAFGATGPSDSLPPTLTLENGSRIKIVDKIGAVVVAAEKKPSSGAYVKSVNGQIVPGGVFPDTLTITLSEVIRPTQPGQPWNSLFGYIPGGKDTGTVVSLEIAGKPIISEDSLTWTIILSENSSFQEGDYLFLLPTAQYADAAGNAPGEMKTQAGGRKKKGKGTLVHVLEPIIGKTRTPLQPILVISGENTGKVPVVANGSIIGFEELDISVSEWYPPYGMNIQGVIDESMQSGCSPLSMSHETPAEVPVNCLSIMVVLTKEPYTADVEIFNNLGQYVHTSTQRFGYCGELNTTGRMTPAGFYKSYLVWNQRDIQGKLVSSGVYPWLINIRYASGKKAKMYRKQGIFRTSNPNPACAFGP